MDLLRVGITLAVYLLLISRCEANSPVFLQAITSSLATIPFSGGPMTTGLAGAKLGIGTKLLYYLGFFGKKAPTSSSKSSSKKPSRKKSGGSRQRAQPPVPLPYMASSGMQQNFQGGMQQSYSPLQTVDPALLYQVLSAQGVDQNVIMQAMSQASVMNSPPVNFASNPMNPGFGGFGGMANPGFQPNLNAGAGAAANTPKVASQAKAPEPADEGDDASEVESFFNFLKDMDENTCISRLICDIGRDPSFLGDFSTNIHSMVGSLRVDPSSGAYPYIAIMEKGRTEGGCESNFPECGDMSYEMVKSVAPTVSLPQNVSPDAINRL